ncbi:uncharacterized protein LOC111340222 isoform X2 [Stylophora pistillata]|uniref:Mitochondria-eating protein n=1 Tax=Stylophora pistillata TaxID=50429 RepID=A0A2B4RM60_STYPI|nr:uncharacterized protein LOC111340222 isoform X2 [Stylophora pistillata]PFX17913.1 hypothetical protein AWC38_SpisGene17741 [Stylophora pistillata]
MTDNVGQEDSERLKKMEGEFRATILERDEELKELKQSFHDMKEKAKSIISARNEELNQLKCRQNEQKEKFKALWESKDQELRELTMRLAHLSENLMKKDQRKVENTVAANRPSEVENDFKEFFDNERMDAIDKMQQVYGSEEESDIGISYPRLACIILEAAYEQTIEVKESALHVFKEIINIMIEEAPEQGQKYLSVEKNKQLSYRVNFKMPTCRQEMKYPTEVVDALVLSLKETAHLCSLESLEKGVRKKIMDKWVSWLTEEKSCKFSFSHRMLFQLKDYIQACIRITWRMIIQVPPMQLEYKSTTLKNLHKKVGYHNVPEVCSRPPSNGQASVVDEIACYLWPALLDGGGRIIQAGEVLCKVEAQAK